MSDYAIIIPASHGYLPGLNGILNALDFYENDCDVEVITNDIPDAYFDEARQAFDFGINVTQLDRLDAVKIEGWSGVRRLHFARYARALQLADIYEAIMFLDADCGLVNNIMNYFRLADKSYLILAAHNVLGTDAFTYKEYHHTNAVPIANMPMFLRPDVNELVFERTIEISKGPGGIDDMPALYYALAENGALPDVVLLPDVLWLNNYFYTTYHQKNDKPIFGGKFYLYANRERVFIFHKRWWQEGHRAHEVAQLAGEAQKIAEHNTKLWQWVYWFFNTQWKVTIDWPC